MIEVTPVNDIREHTSGSTCACQPRVTFENGEMIVVHSSWDGREAVEEFYASLEEKPARHWDNLQPPEDDTIR